MSQDSCFSYQRSQARRYLLSCIPYQKHWRKAPLLTYEIAFSLLNSMAQLILTTSCLAKHLWCSKSAIFDWSQESLYPTINSCCVQASKPERNRRKLVPPKPSKPHACIFPSVKEQQRTQQKVFRGAAGNPWTQGCEEMGLQQQQLTLSLASVPVPTALAGSTGRLETRAEKVSKKKKK